MTIEALLVPEEPEYEPSAKVHPLIQRANRALCNTALLTSSLALTKTLLKLKFTSSYSNICTINTTNG
jgi:hypothetical protein